MTPEDRSKHTYEAAHTKRAGGLSWVRAAALGAVALGCACRPSAAPDTPQTDSPMVAEGADEAVTPSHHVAQRPFCCEACNFVEGDGLRCEACAPAADEACVSKTVDCGDTKTLWDADTQTLACPAATNTVVSASAG